MLPFLLPCNPYTCLCFSDGDALAQLQCHLCVSRVGYFLRSSSRHRIVRVLIPLLPPTLSAASRTRSTLPHPKLPLNYGPAATPHDVSMSLLGGSGVLSAVWFVLSSESSSSSGVLRFPVIRRGPKGGMPWTVSAWLQNVSSEPSVLWQCGCGQTAGGTSS